MMAEDSDVRRAYAARSAEYIDALGDIKAMSPVDRERIATWARGVDGPVLDVGCGPGHWSGYLHELGTRVEGIDMVPEFIASARIRFPDVEFRQGRLDSLPIETESLAGMLSWYSVIHTVPVRMPGLLAEFARCLAPGGSLLLGFFEGPRVEAFAHAVTAAYSWPVDDMVRRLERAGFRIVDTRTRKDPGSRPHADIAAVLESRS